MTKTGEEQKKELVALANKLLDIAEADLKKTGEVRPSFTFFWDDGRAARTVYPPPHIMNSGAAKDKFTQAMRELIEAAQASGVLSLLDTFFAAFTRGSVPPEVVEAINSGRMQVAEAMKRGFIQQQEAVFAGFEHREGWSFHVVMRYRRVNGAVEIQSREHMDLSHMDGRFMGWFPMTKATPEGSKPV